MNGPSSDRTDGETRTWPSVTIVFLVYNRRDELRKSLRQMLVESDYDAERIDVIVVDNASTDGSASMVREEFPEVRVVVRDDNVGVSGWNDGFALADGDYVLALDDDCYLPADGLRRAVEAAEREDADMVSFKVRASEDPTVVFTDNYRTGLFMFWGCAVLMRRHVVKALGGYDPEIFVWANELEFSLRFFDEGFLHLHAPDIVAVHMKPIVAEEDWRVIEPRSYRFNARHWAYIVAKLFRRRDAAEAFFAILARIVRDGLRTDRVAFTAIPEAFKGLVHGLRHRKPLRNAEISHFYRRNFETFASPWWLSRPTGELLRSMPKELLQDMLGVKRALPPGRREQYFAERGRYYPDRRETLRF